MAMEVSLTKVEQTSMQCILILKIITLIGIILRIITEVEYTDQQAKAVALIWFMLAVQLCMLSMARQHPSTTMQKCCMASAQPAYF